MCFILNPWATRRASSSSWSANGAFDTTETASAPRDSSARSAAPSSTVQTRRWRGARRQGAVAGAANKRALAHVDEGPRNSKRRASAASTEVRDVFLRKFMAPLLPL